MQQGCRLRGRVSATRQFSQRFDTIFEIDRMGSFNFTIPRTERPADLLSRMPRAFRDQAEKGFVVLAEVGKQHYAELLRAVVVTLESKKPPLDDLEKSLKMSPSYLSTLFAAAMLTVPLLSQGINAEEFFASAVKAEIIPQNLVSKIRPFVDTVVAESAQIGRVIRRAALPAQVLPYMSDVEVAVDLRMAFEEEAVLEAVPVAIVHIDTDADGEEIWFQASIQQMRQLKNDVEEAIKRMEAADAWSTGRGSAL